MKLQRYTTNVLWDDAGGFRERGATVYLAADVDAMLTSIRAAVEAWMMAPRGETSCDDPDCGCWDSYNEARAALHNLLAPSPAVPPRRDDKETARDG